MSDSPMTNGQPKKYWFFRNLVSIVQLALVTVLFISVIIWAASDGNGARIWNDYYEFAKGMSTWANNDLHLPWEH